LTGGGPDGCRCPCLGAGRPHHRETKDGAGEEPLRPQLYPARQHQYPPRRKTPIPTFMHATTQRSVSTSTSSPGCGRPFPNAMPGGSKTTSTPVGWPRPPRCFLVFMILPPLRTNGWTRPSLRRSHGDRRRLGPHRVGIPFPLEDGPAHRRDYRRGGPGNLTGKDVLAMLDGYSELPVRHTAPPGFFWQRSSTKARRTHRFACPCGDLNPIREVQAKGYDPGPTRKIDINWAGETRTDGMIVRQGRFPRGEPYGPR
jgi:hypothetical protein